MGERAGAFGLAKATLRAYLVAMQNDLGQTRTGMDLDLVLVVRQS